jgi:MHS family shikimate/dehydroshikimate transporter-like MFS transporter
VADPVSMRRVVASAAIGTIVDWYDFFLYGTASALVFPKLFFPSANHAIGTLLSFAVYATGFVARPLGGALCGHFGDRLGRKRVLMFTLLSMGLATTAIGLLPTYRSIGVAAPILLVVIRIMQGFAAGGEWGGASLLTLEHTSRRRGFWGSFLSAAVYVGLLIGNLIFLILNGTLGKAAVLDWAWRVPFVLSILIVAVGLFMRRAVDETPEFEQVKTTGARARFPVFDAIRTHPRNVIAIFLMRVGQNTCFYIVSVFCLSYATGTLGISSQVTLTALLVGAGVAVLMCPVWGSLADRFGFGRIMTFSLLAGAASAFPLFLVLRTTQAVPIVVFIAAVIAIANASNDAIQPGYFTSLFGANIRYSGMSVGREGGTIIGGGLAPLIATWLLSTFGGWWAVAAWIVVTSLAGVVGVALVSELRSEEAAGSAPIMSEARPQGTVA